MKIKRLTGTDMRQAIHKVRDALVSRTVTIMQNVGVGTKDDPISTMLVGMAMHVHG